MSKKVVTFGEVMMRLAPPGYQRFVQTNSFDATYAGLDGGHSVGGNERLFYNAHICIPPAEIFVTTRDKSSFTKYPTPGKR